MFGVHIFVVAYTFNFVGLQSIIVQRTLARTVANVLATTLVTPVNVHLNLQERTANKVRTWQQISTMQNEAKIFILFNTLRTINGEKRRQNSF